MISVIQRVSHASVVVDNQTIGEIQQGIAALVGIEKFDNLNSAEKLLKKILNYRIFPDAQQKMNLSLLDISGGLLLIPQFTLVAQTNKGTRPGFSRGMPPAEGKLLFEDMVNLAKSLHPHIAGGAFGADMAIHLCNQGPVTFILND